MKGKYFGWLVVTSLVVVLVYVMRFFLSDPRELEFFVTLIGALFTILGITVTFDQIQQTRSKTEETRLAVEDTKSRMQTIAKAFSITDAIRLAEGTEQYLRNRSVGESLIKLQEFSQLLININDKELMQSDNDTSQNITRQMQLIRRDISSLNRTEAEHHNIEWNNIIGHVEDTRIMLAD